MKQLAFDFFNAEPITDKQTGEGPLRRQPRLPKAPPDFEKRESFTLTPAFSYRLERVKRKTVGFVIDERGLDSEKVSAICQLAKGSGHAGCSL